MVIFQKKKIAILGFSFKADTNDTRESPAIYIAKDLLEEGANLVIHDPKVDADQIAKDLGKQYIIKKDIPQEGDWIFEKDIKNACVDSDAIIILTEWDEYFKIDWKEIAKIMRKPSWVFDSRSVINPKDFVNLDLNIWRIGDGSNG